MYPNDILLPSNSKYITFIDNKSGFNLYWDTVWSFSYTLSGNEHALCSFLSISSNPLSSSMGQYLGILNSPIATSPSVLSIAIDSTGLFALSTAYNNGLAVSAIKANSLTIRDSNNVLSHDSLSSLDESFTLSGLDYKYLRFRLSNAAKKLYIDYKLTNSTYKNLKTLELSTLIPDNRLVYPGFSFTSPVSSIKTPSKLVLKNFHTQGEPNNPTYEDLPFEKFSNQFEKPIYQLSSVL